jgi:hypothetical protein
MRDHANDPADEEPARDGALDENYAATERLQYQKDHIWLALHCR